VVLSESSARLEPGVATWLRSPVPWAIGTALCLVAYVYGPLLFAEVSGDLEGQGDQFFFEANEAAGAPVLVLSLWLFYRRSHLRDLLASAGNPLAGGLTLLASISLYYWGYMTRGDDLMLASLIGMLAGSALMLGGWPALRAYWVPILFMGFALPLSPVLISAVIWPIQLATAQYAGWILNLIGVASYVQGDQILRPEATFIVIETCSGLRTVVTLTMLTVLLIDLFERRGGHAVLLLALAPVVALLTNGLRVVTLVLNPHSDVASIHSLQGIVMLLVGLTGMYLIDGLIDYTRWFHGVQRDPGDFGLAAAAVAPSPRRTLRLFSPALALVCMIAVGFVAKPWNVQKEMVAVDDLVADALEGWPSQTVDEDYQFRGSVWYRGWSRREVVVDSGTVEIFIGFSDSRVRQLSMFSPRFAWPSSGYAVQSDDVEPLAPGLPNARRLVLRRGARRLLAYSWYEPRPAMPIEVLRHALALDRSPFARTDETVAVRLATRIRGKSSPEDAEARLQKVYDRIEPVISTLQRGLRAPNPVPR
jgi:exosortase